MVTINKREISLESLISQFENGEDGIYNLINNDKTQLFKPKVSITKQDLIDIPELQQVREAIQQWEAFLKTASGKDAYIAKKAIIDLRKDQYLIRDAYKPKVGLKNSFQPKNPILLDGEITVAEDGTLISHGINLINPKVVSTILCYYNRLRQECEGVYDTYTWGLLEYFDKLAARALTNEPIYACIAREKVAQTSNAEIQRILEEECGVHFSVEHISSLWRNKIPNLIASAAEDDFLDWYYLEVARGRYKKCSRCGQIKLVHNKYFSKNSTSKDGYYSICKACRNKGGKRK